VSCLAHQIDNRPVFFALLQVINPQANGFVPPQPYLALAKESEPARQSTSFQGEHPVSSHL
jgi:hypothetical protein